MEKKLVLIDGNSIINRAFYAIPLLTNQNGEYCNAIYGFCNILVKIILDEKPDYMAICFDAAKKTFRNDIYAEYKGTRKPTPPELSQQFPLLKQILKSMGIYIVEQKGIEADDLIGTLSKKFSFKTIIFSGDKDLLQLIDTKTEVHLTKKGVTDIQVMNEQTLLETMGVKPKQIIELKALMGDSSDNIPGVKGIGEKSAHNLIEKYENIENLYDHILEITGKQYEKLVDGKDMAFMSKQLATINTNVNINVSLQDLTYNFPFDKKVYDHFKYFEFNSLIKRPNIFNLNDINVEQKNSENIVNSCDNLIQIINLVKTKNILGIYINNNIHLAIDDKLEYIIECANVQNQQAIQLNEALKLLKPIFEDESILKTCFDVKKIKHILAKYDINLKGETFDCMIANYLLIGSQKSSTEIEVFCTKNGFEETSIACCLVSCFSKFTQKLKEDGLYDLYSTLEHPLLNILFDMEQSGFKVDKQKVYQLSEVYQNEISILKDQIITLAGEDFNLNSPKQLGEILFDKLKLPQYKKNGSTSVEVLEKIRNYHPIVDKILRYRKIVKLEGTYLAEFKRLLDNNNLIHTEFKQALTSTGRLSSVEPNLQNLPIRDEEGKNLRALFISRFENGSIISADYSQIELRLLAHYSADPKLVDAYNKNLDIHSATASDIFGVDINDVTELQRRQAKAINFGIIYGMSEFGLGQTLNIRSTEAKIFIEKYFETYPYVKKYMLDAVEKVKQTGFASTLFGRKRKILEINSPNYSERQFAERASMNMPLQGSASDLIKKAMISVYNALKSQNLKSKLVLQIHDELIVDCYPGEEEKVKHILKTCMENAMQLSVPLVVVVSVGKNLLEAKWV